MHLHHLRAAPQFPRDGGNPATCRRCVLWREATQAVVGEGPRGARLMLIGEAPGSDEDRVGHPFVGPAGVLLRELLRDVGVDPSDAFLTNAVKHFCSQQRGRRRMQKAPAQGEIEACNIWLRREIDDINPRVIVTLGTTAIKAILGERIAIVAARERSLRGPGGIPVVATYHPLALLRAPAQQEKEALRRTVIEDLGRARRLAGD